MREKLRAVIEQAIRDGLYAQDGDWIAETDDKEISFRPGENGQISILVENEEQETEYLFEVCVRSI